jgi:hypothetical protein
VIIRTRLNISITLPSISARPRRRHVARAVRRIALRRDCSFRSAFWGLCFCYPSCPTMLLSPPFDAVVDDDRDKAEARAGLQGLARAQRYLDCEAADKGFPIVDRRNQIRLAPRAPSPEPRAPSHCFIASCSCSWNKLVSIEVSGFGSAREKIVRIWSRARKKSLCEPWLNRLGYM